MNSNTLSKVDKVIQLYLELSSQKKVAKELSMSTKTVRKILKANNVQRKAIKREVKCRNCGKLFVTDNERKISCSEKCRSSYNKRNRGHKRTCETCGITFYKYREQSHCSKQCFMEYLEQKSKQKELLTRLVKAIDPSRQKKCIECNQTFYARYRNKTFCSEKCSSSHLRFGMRLLKPGRILLFYLSAFIELQILCASFTLFHVCVPPFANGITWSILPYILWL